MNTSQVLFIVGIALLIVSLAVNSYIWYTLYRPVVEVGLIGDIPWTTLIVGIILTSLGYRNKSQNND
jgi:hypothetical protein